MGKKYKIIGKAGAKTTTNDGELAKIYTHYIEKENSNAVIVTKLVLTKQKPPEHVDFPIVKQFKDYFLVRQNISLKLDTYIQIAHWAHELRTINPAPKA